MNGYGFVIITPHFTTISKIRHDQCAVQAIQSRASQYMLDSIHHGYMFCNFVSYNVNVIIPIKLRVHMSSRWVVYPRLLVSHVKR